MLPMSTPERRKTLRTVMERLAYINIEPNNGGIVLNVSNNGLCFHSIAPVERRGKLRFSLLEQNRRIEADGELTWMDEAQKVGGLKFSILSEEAQDQIEDWISEPSTPLSTADAHGPSAQWPSSLTRTSAVLPGTAAGPAAALASSPPTKTTASNPAASPAPATPVARAKAAAPQQKVAAEETHLKAESPEVKPSSRRPSDAITVGGASRSAALPGVIAPPVLTSQNSGSRLLGLLSEKPTPLPRLDTSSAANVEAVDSGTKTSGTARMYFEVGKFKEQLWARKATDELGHLGFPASIAKKSGILKKSYYVLVGPYLDRTEAEAVHNNLASRGFKPRPFERGSRTFMLSSPVRLNGTEMPLGEFVIRWESYVPDAKVKFLQNDDLVVTVDGRWVDRGVKNERNAFVYQKRGDGSRNLLEIRFAGMSRVLAFSNPS
ncbi:MAG: hypothetical protein DMF61_27300 [Blastocatellia bacterium AA13]|nr:MAG: hypothetical protein DMF61_27300 [Blastocatellia bacterium AA13]